MLFASGQITEQASLLKNVSMHWIHDGQQRTCLPRYLELSLKVSDFKSSPNAALDSSFCSASNQSELTHWSIFKCTEYIIVNSKPYLQTPLCVTDYINATHAAQHGNLLHKLYCMRFFLTARYWSVVRTRTILYRFHIWIRVVCFCCWYQIFWPFLPLIVGVFFPRIVLSDL